MSLSKEELELAKQLCEKAADLQLPADLIEWGQPCPDNKPGCLVGHGIRVKHQLTEFVTAARTLLPKALTHIEQLTEEIEKLKAMESLLDDYIEDMRFERINLHNFMQLMALSSWQQGKAKEAFFNRANIYSDDFTNNIQQLENALVVIIDTRKALETYYLSTNTVM